MAAQAAAVLGDLPTIHLEWFDVPRIVQMEDLASAGADVLSCAG